MAKKITELIELSAIATNDLFVVEDISASTTKKITWDNLVDDASITTAKVANDAITDAKLIYGKVRKRQGSSATNWRATGTTSYDYDAANVFIQVGYTGTGTGADTTITFPVAFNEKPLLFLTINGGATTAGDSAITQNAFAEVSGAITTTSAVIRTINTGGAQSDQSVAWMAIGQ